MRQDWRNSHPNREHGFVICEVNGDLVRGTETVGGPYGVNINTRCQRGKRVGSFHTHPHGQAQPSQADIREGYKHKMDVCIGVPETGELKCYRASSLTRARLLRG